MIPLNSGACFDCEDPSVWFIVWISGLIFAFCAGLILSAVSYAEYRDVKNYDGLYKGRKKKARRTLLFLSSIFLSPFWPILLATVGSYFFVRELTSIVRDSLKVDS